MRSHSSSVMSPCVVRHVLLGCSGVFVMNISIVVASAPLVANGPFRSANFRNSLLAAGASASGTGPFLIESENDGASWHFQDVSVSPAVLSSASSGHEAALEIGRDLGYGPVPLRQPVVGVCGPRLDVRGGFRARLVSSYAQPMEAGTGRR